MKIATKFDAMGKYVSHCTDRTITKLKDILPSGEGFEFYETELDISKANYFKLVNGTIVLDEERKQAVEDMQKKTCEREAIESWFKEYDRRVSEHSRCIRLDIPCHHDICSLDAEAVIRAKRLRELREEAGEN